MNTLLLSLSYTEQRYEAAMHRLRQAIKDHDNAYMLAYNECADTDNYGDAEITAYKEYLRALSNAIGWASRS